MLTAAGVQRLKLPGGHLCLLPEGAAYEPSTGALLVADVHLGKAETFRRFGVPVPGRTSGAGLRRLSALIARWQPARLIFLGDLIHDRLAPEHRLYTDLVRWRGEHSALPMTLVIGNHDRKAGALPRACDIAAVEPGTTAGPLCLLHEPRQMSADESYGVAGHIHPVVRLNGRADSVRLPCFWVRPQLTVLPAFGEFTGGYRIQPDSCDKVYVLDGSSVLALPQSFDANQ